MSGVETRPVPINILEWPRIRDMIMQQKFIYSEMYFNPNASSCGCYLYGIESTAARLGMTSNSLEDAITEFERRGLIEYDKATGELYVIDWPRWHIYKTPAAKGALHSSIEKIQSPRLSAIAKKAYESTLDDWKGKEKVKASSTKAEEALSAARRHAVSRKTPRQPSKSKSGILCWTDNDRCMAEDIERRYGTEEVSQAIAAMAPGTVPLPSRVEELILATRRRDAVREQRAEAERQFTHSHNSEAEDSLKLHMRSMSDAQMAEYRQQYEQLRRNKDGSVEPMFSLWLRRQLGVIPPTQPMA